MRKSLKGNQYIRQFDKLMTILLYLVSNINSRKTKEGARYYILAEGHRKTLKAASRLAGTQIYL